MASLKYQENGEIKELAVKIGDTLPIGTEVDYNGSAAPSGWVEIEDLNDKYVSVGNTAPTTGERVWFKKSNNLFNNLVVSNTSNGASGTILSTGIRAKVTTAGTNKYVGYKLPNPEQLLGKVVTISATITKSSSNDGLIRFYWANGDTITTNINTAISSTGNKTFTMPSAFPSGSNQILIVFSATASNTGAVDDYVDYTNVMLEYGETATQYTQYGLYSINVDNEEIYSKPVVLWTNLSPTSDFSAQDITLSNSLADFEYYEVLFLMSKYESLCVSTGLIPASMGTSLLSLRNSGSTGTISRYRDVTKTNDTTLAVTTCYQSTGGNVSQDTKKDRVIPYKIIGHKH